MIINREISQMPVSKGKTVSLKKFLILPDILAKSIGLIPYEEDTKRPFYEVLMQIIFLINMVNMNVVLIAEIMFIFRAIKYGNNFVEATMSLSYIGFVCVGQIKILSVLGKKKTLTQLMRNLNRLYPKDEQSQESYKIGWYVRRFNMVSLGFVTVHEILIWYYNLYALVSYFIYDFWLGWRIVPRTFPYHLWVPWQWDGHWSYYLIYASEDLAGHTCMSGQLANDLLLCVVAVQIIMHYEYLATRLRDYVPKNTYDQDLLFLKESIKHHQEIIHLSTLMNDVFGVSLLVNFISSAFIMCFLGFQMTIGVEPDTLVMLFMFLFCSLVQLFMICNYGEELVTKSESIGHAVYEQDWINSDLRYRKMLIPIIQRAQKPTILKATMFLSVSMGTATDIVQLSYKFFALIRTMYAK